MISAYLQIYNDDDFLLDCLESIKNYVDELVVVDGCYEWMAFYYSHLGLDPVRSSNKTYEIIANSGIPFTSINKIWKNQLEKRTAGYAACKNRYVLRLDSDEIIYFYEGMLDKFLSSDSKIAHIDMPEILTPNLLISGLNNISPKQCFLFDSNFVSPENHLHYLWLVLHVDSFNSNLKDFQVFPQAIAFNAHLTGWRTTKTSINRASYYSMNWMRKNGFPQLIFPNNQQGIINFENFFETAITPENLQSVLKFSEINLGCTSINADQEINLIPEDFKSTVLTTRYDEFITSQEESISAICNRPFIPGNSMFIHLSNGAEFFRYEGEVDSEIIGIEAEMVAVSPIKPHNILLKLNTEFSGKKFSINNFSPFLESPLIRSAIKFNIFTKSSGSLGYITLWAQ